MKSIFVILFSSGLNTGVLKVVVFVVVVIMLLYSFVSKQNTSFSVTVSPSKWPTAAAAILLDRLTGSERLHFLFMWGGEALLYLVKHPLSLEFVPERSAEGQTTKDHCIHYDATTTDDMHAISTTDRLIDRRAHTEEGRRMHRHTDTQTHTVNRGRFTDRHTGRETDIQTYVDIHKDTEEKRLIRRRIRIHRHTNTGRETIQRHRPTYRCTYRKTTKHTVKRLCKQYRKVYTDEHTEIM